MKAALSIVLAALLIMLPVEQVLAQAAQQADVTVQQAGPSDGAAHLFRVPPLTENSARLLGASSDSVLLVPSLSNTDAAVGWSDWSNGKRVLVVAGITIAVALAVAVIYVLAASCAGAGTC